MRDADSRRVTYDRGEVYRVNSSEAISRAALRRLGKRQAGAARGGGKAGISVQIRGDDRSKIGRIKNSEIEKSSKSQQKRTEVD
jgi:hypothetical protein